MCKICDWCKEGGYFRFSSLYLLYFDVSIFLLINLKGFLRMKKGVLLMAMCAMVGGFISSCKEDDPEPENKTVKYELEKTLVGEWNRVYLSYQPYVETRKYTFNEDHTGSVDYYGDIVAKGETSIVDVDLRSWGTVDFSWSVDSDSSFEIRPLKANLRSGINPIKDTLFTQGKTIRFFLDKEATDTLEFHSCGYLHVYQNSVFAVSCGEEDLSPVDENYLFRLYR